MYPTHWRSECSSRVDPGRGPRGHVHPPPPPPPTQPDTEILIIEILVGLSVLAKSVYHCVHRPIGVGSGGARGRLAPPKFQVGGASPPNFTHCLHNELHCSIVDRIACRHCSSRKSHFCCLKKKSSPQVRTSSYAYADPM